MHVPLAIALIAILSALALLHVHWALGGRLALSGAVPSDGDRPLFKPGPAASLAVAFALSAAAALCAIRAGFVALDASAWIARLGVWAIAIAFAARAVGDFRYVGFFKRVRGTLFATRDSRIYSPLCAVIAALAAGVALNAP